jgi:hypothetical protein
MDCGVTRPVESILAQAVIASLESSDSVAVDDLSTGDSWPMCPCEATSSEPLVLILEPGSLHGDSGEVGIEEPELEKGGIRPVSVSLDVPEAVLEELSDPDMVAWRFRAVAGELVRSRLFMILVEE